MFPLYTVASNNVAFDIVSGTFTGKVDTADIATRAGGNLVVSDGNKFYVGATATATVESATSGTFTVVSGNGNLTIKGGVTVKNNTEEPITVNGKEIPAEGSYTEPTNITIIVPGDTTPAETPKPAEDQKNPSTGANDMVAAAAALMAVAALGMSILSRKK